MNAFEQIRAAVNLPGKCLDDLQVAAVDKFAEIATDKKYVGATKQLVLMFADQVEITDYDGTKYNAGTLAKFCDTLVGRSGLTKNGPAKLTSKGVVEVPLQLSVVQVIPLPFGKSKTISLPPIPLKAVFHFTDMVKVSTLNISQNVL